MKLPGLPGHRLRTTVILAAGLQAAGIILLLLANILLARLLGAAEYGVYAYALAVVTMAGIPAVIGLPPAIVQQVAVLETRADWGLLRGYLVWANTAGLALSGVLAALGAIIIGLFLTDGPLAAGATLALALLLLPLRALGALRGAALRGLHRNLSGQLPESLVHPGLLVVFCATLFVLTGPGSLVAGQAMALQVAATALAFVVGAVLLVRLLPPAVRQAKARYESGDWRRNGVILASSGSVRAANEQVAALLLGPIAGAEAVGLYAVASRGAALIAFMLNAVNVTLASSFAGLHTTGDHSRLQRLVTRSARLILVTSAPLALLMIVFSEQLLAGLFGREFAAAATVLAILAVGQILHVAAGSAGILLNMTGHGAVSARAHVLALVATIVLCAILIPPYGATGAAIAVSLGRLLADAVMTIAVRRRLKLDSTAVGRRPAGAYRSGMV